MINTTQFQVFSFLLLLAKSYAQPATIKLLEPADTTVFALRKDVFKYDVTFIYEVINLNSFNTQTCLQLENIKSKELVLPSTCFPATNGNVTKTLEDVPVGIFRLSMILREASPPHTLFEESKIVTVFTVLKI